MHKHFTAVLHMRDQWNANIGSTWVERNLQHRAVAADVGKVAGVVVLEGLGNVAEALGAADGRDAVRIEEASQIGALL